MDKNRCMELLNNLVNQVANGNNTSGQIEELLKYGFTGEELVKDFSYSKTEVEYHTGETIPEDTEKKVKLHARVTKEIEVSYEQAERLYNLLSGCVEHCDVEDIKEMFRKDADNCYEAGYIPTEWARADLYNNFRPLSGLNINDDYCYADKDIDL